MAGELQADWTTGTVVYFLIRDANGNVWNGASFGVYSSGSYSTYSVTGTEQGTSSGFYTGTMPAVAAGVYSIEAKQRIGVSVAESDPTVGIGNIDWNGSISAGAGNSYVTSNVKKNQALSNFRFLMTDSTNHAPATGKTVTVTRGIDNGAQASGTLSAVTEIGNGEYRVDFAAADLNGNVVVLRATATGCDDTFERILTQP